MKLGRHRQVVHTKCKWPPCATEWNPPMKIFYERHFFHHTLTFMTKQRLQFGCGYLQRAQEVSKSLILSSNYSRTSLLCCISTQIASFSRHLCSRRDARVDTPMPKERLLGKVTSKIQIHLDWTKPKIFIFSSDYCNCQKVKLAEKS